MLALHRNLIGEGSHRRLSSSVRLEIQVSAQSCQAIVIERLPSGVFADPFELQHLVQRKGIRSIVLIFFFSFLFLKILCVQMALCFLGWLLF